MKKITIIFIFLVCALHEGAGQTMSEKASIPSITGMDMLMKLRPDGTQIVYYQDGLGRNNFIGISSIYSTHYTAPVVANTVGQMRYEVKDMRVLGNKLFLCGTLVSPQNIYMLEHGWTTIMKHTGFVARMDITNFLTLVNPHAECEYSTVSGTSEISKMDIHVEGEDTLIGMIGLTDADTVKSCLITVTGNASRWKYNIFSMPNVDETLTDIVMAGKSLITASRFRNEHKTFGLRYAYYIHPFYENDITEYNQLQKFYTQNMSVVMGGTTQYPTWHPNDATIRLASIPYSDDVVVAYECKRFNNTIDSAFAPKSLAMHYIDGANPSLPVMTGAWLTPCLSINAESFAGIKYDHSNRNIAVLLKSLSDYTQDVTYLFNMSSNNIQEYRTQTEKMESMDMVNNKLCVCGKDVDDNKLFYFKQVPSVSKSCIGTNTTSAYPMSNLTSPAIIHSNADIYRQDENLTWGYNPSLSVSFVFQDIDCSH